MTPSPISTLTAVPTATQMSATNISGSLDDMQPVAFPVAGFSFTPLINYEIYFQGQGASMQGYATGILLYSSAKFHDQTLEEALQWELETLTAGVDIQEVSEPYATQLTGKTACALDLKYTFPEMASTGRIVAVEQDNYRRFFMLIVLVDPPLGLAWDQRGEDIYKALADSVVFFEPEPTGNYCYVSEDSTYGYDPLNPIRLGGGSYGGPAREKAYLDTLQGPEGETITYEQIGTVDGESTILDQYQVSYPGSSESIVLYIDVYSYENFDAPLGLSCGGPFPFRGVE